MSIHYLDEDWPEPKEQTSRWSYEIGDTVIFVDYQDEPTSLQVRFA
jgi:hypothetical protein